MARAGRGFLPYRACSRPETDVQKEAFSAIIQLCTLDARADPAVSEGVEGIYESGHYGGGTGDEAQAVD